MWSFFAASFCFGLMAVFVRVSTRELPAMQVAFVRFAGSFVLLLVAARGRGLRPRPGNVGRVVQRGVLGATSILCYFVAISRAGAGLATLLHSTYPVWTALLAVLFLGERFGPRLAAALTVSVVGATVALWERLGAGSAVATGVPIGVLGGMLAGGAVSTAGELRRTESASLVTVWFMAVGALLTAPSLLGGMATPTAGGAAALAAVVVTSASGQWLLHHGLGFVSPTIGSLAAATSVVTAAVCEAAVTGEPITGRLVVGGGLMILAVGLAAGRRAAVDPDGDAAPMAASPADADQAGTVSG